MVDQQFYLFEENTAGGLRRNAEDLKGSLLT